MVTAYLMILRTNGGLNKNNAGDAVRIAENGYTMIENYALSLEFPNEYEKAWKDAYGE